MRRRLLTSYLALTVIVLITLEVPLALSYRARERAQVSTTLQRDAFVIANYSEETLEGDAHAPIQQHLESYTQQTGAHAVVVDAKGNVVANSSPIVTSPEAITRRPEVQAALAGHTTTGVRADDDESVMFAAVPVSTSGHVIGAVRVAYPTTQVDARVRRYWLVLLAGGLACLAAAAIVGWLLARWVTRPLVPLRRAAARLGQGDLHARAGEHPGPPEIQELCRTFDEMAAELEGLVGAQEAFVADASHQLRTPLTGLQLRLENLEGEIADPEAREDLAGAVRETRRLSRLVDGLLTLARADRQGGAGDRQSMELAAVADERIDMWRPVAEESGIELVGTESPLEVRGSVDRVAQIMDNLLANAVDASPSGSRIWVDVRRSDNHRRVELHVIDEGPGLDSEQRRHAFDRFWRGDRDGARTADGAASTVPANGDGPPGRGPLGGSGLGLAIVARLAAADGGESELREAPSGGVDAVVSYPSTDGADG
jgi:signal transduction histidine kinase